MRPPGWSLFCFNSLQTGKSFRTYVFQHHPYNISEQFQFPSNGKVLSDEQNPLARFTAAIMFQFPSNGKVLSDMWIYTVGAVSLGELFQFPSNGKVLSDSSLLFSSDVLAEIVSIPFKRESPFGLGSNGTACQYVS